MSFKRGLYAIGAITCLTSGFMLAAQRFVFDQQPNPQRADGTVSYYIADETSQVGPLKIHLTDTTVSMPALQYDLSYPLAGGLILVGAGLVAEIRRTRKDAPRP